MKVQIEQAEARLAPILPFPFAVTAVPDVRLGEAVTLLYAASSEQPDLLQRCRDVLPPYWCPKHCYRVASIPQTGSGKVSRAEVKELARRLAKG